MKNGGILLLTKNKETKKLTFDFIEFSTIYFGFFLNYCDSFILVTESQFFLL